MPPAVPPFPSSAPEPDGRIAELEREITRLQAALMCRETPVDDDNQLLLTVLQTGPSAIVLLDPAGQIRYANHRAMEVLGLSYSSLLERSYNAPEWHITDVDGGAWPEEKQPFVRVLTTGQPVYEIRHAIEWPDGRRRILSVSGAPLRDDAGKITSLVFAVNDITGSFETARRLQESEEWLEAALRGTGLGVWSWEVGSERVRWSPPLYRLFDVTPEEFDGSFTQYRRLIPDADWPTIEQALHRVLALGEPGYEVQHRVFLKSGAVRWIEGRATVLRDDAGRAVRLTGTAMDITARIDAAHALRESEAKLRALTDSLPFAIWIRDRSRRVTFQNSASLQAWGDLTGTTPEELPVSGPVRQFSLVNVSRAFAGEHVDTEIEMPVGNEPRIFRALMAPLRVGEEITGIVGATMDVTEQRRLERQVQQTAQIESLGRLAAGVAHDFNNLLAAIMGLASVAATDGRLPAELAPDLEGIVAAARRGSALTRRLLAFTRHRPGELKTLAAGLLLQNFLPLARAVLGSAIELEVDTGPAELRVRTDPAQIEQILLNLLVNARDAMPRGGHARLAVRPCVLAETAAATLRVQAGQFAAFDVTDNGPGIAPAVRARLFEPFFTTKPIGQGTGLGLSGSLAIARQHGGGIAVESVPGAGSTFTLLLPATDGEHEPRAETPAAACPGGTEAILVVEDDADIRSTLQRQLAGLGYLVAIATDGLSALELAARAPGGFRAVVTDLVMPRLGGVDFVNQLRARDPHIRVLYISGQAEGGGALRETAHERLLAKPFDRATLAVALRAVLDAP